MAVDNLQNDSAFVTLDDKENIYGSPTRAVPKPEKNIGIDTHGDFLQAMIDAGTSSQLDISKLESFLNVSQNRNEIYNMLDSMAEDATIAAVLEIYASEATEYNDDGRIMWAESDNSEITKYITFLLDTMNVDKNIYKWVYSLCKYGDVYLRLYRESEYDDPIFNVRADKVDKQRDSLNEDVVVKAFAKNDKYVHYIEQVPNPAEMFELTRFGKTYGYIKADTGLSASQQLNGSTMSSFYRYNFKKKDVEVYEATEFVHACLEDNGSRTPEEVNIFMDDGIDVENSTNKSYSYTVRRGQSPLQAVFKAWRELMLLQNSVLLNRLTKSSIVRVVGVEIGDMPKESVGAHLQGIKNLMEQKAAINTGNSMTEYTNPGPVENIIYVPTRNGIGNITTQQIGGDVDVKSLADLDYFNDVVFGGLRIPKQYMGRTDDSTGFNGGTSLSIISSRFAKYIKRVQNTIIQAITDAINLMLIDKGLSNYINKFQLHMLAPTTQEDIDRRDNMASRIGIIGDIMNNLTEMESTSAKLRVLKILLSDVITNPDILDTIQEQIDTMEEQEDEGIGIESEKSEEEFTDTDFEPERSERPSRPVERETDFSASSEIIEPNEGTSMNLPSPEDLGVDMTDNNAEI